MIKATNIHKSYGKLKVLKGIDLTIEDKEIISIIGKSGAGKSTLLHILGTLDVPDKGNIIIDQTDISSLSPAKISKFRNQKIGFIFQFHHLLNEFNAIENVMMPALLGGKSKIEAKQKALKILDFLGLNDRTTHKPNELSGGEQQRVAVARALINEPAVVFADEPTGNLDNQTSDEIHHLIKRLRDEIGQTFVIVTHNQELASMSDRIITMQDGLIVEHQ